MSETSKFSENNDDKGKIMGCDLKRVFLPVELKFQLNIVCIFGKTYDNLHLYRTLFNFTMLPGGEIPGAER